MEMRFLVWKSIRRIHTLKHILSRSVNALFLYMNGSSGIIMSAAYQTYFVFHRTPRL